MNSNGSEFRITGDDAFMKFHHSVNSLENNRVVSVSGHGGTGELSVFVGGDNKWDTSFSIPISTSSNEVNLDYTKQRLSSSVAALPNGDFLITWSSYSSISSSYDVYAQRYDSDGNEVESVFQVNTYTFGEQSASNITSVDNGFVITWHSEGQDGSESGIFGQRYDLSGAKIGSEFQVNTYKNNYQSFPSSTNLPNGEFLVTWSSMNQGGERFDIYGQKFNSDNLKVGDEFKVNSYTENDQWLSNVAGLSDGGFFITWQSYQQDGSGYGVYGQQYDEDGLAIGDEVQINSYTIDDQYEPDIVSLSDGGFVVNWQSVGQDGYTNNAYAKHYGVNGEPVSINSSNFVLYNLINDTLDGFNPPRAEGTLRDTGIGLDTISYYFPSNEMSFSLDSSNWLVVQNTLGLSETLI